MVGCINALLSFRFWLVIGALLIATILLPLRAEWLA
jgi:hypothetical protein